MQFHREEVFAMSDKYQYFTIPIASVPASPPYTVWFATWSAAQSRYEWSQTRPAGAATGTTTTWVCGATENGVPAGATVIIPASAKCIDPPPLLVPRNASEIEFRAVLQKQLIQSLDGMRSL
jgi:hypothetical protein